MKQSEYSGTYKISTALGGAIPASQDLNFSPSTIRQGDLPLGGVFLSKPYTSGAVTRVLLDLNVGGV
jgi:hypothetical protein